MPFGLTLGGSSSVPVPARYFAGTVVLGEHTETVIMSEELWSPEDYLTHWRTSAAAILHSDEAVLFCTDYSSARCACFVGWRDHSNAAFEEWVLPATQVAAEGCVVRPIGDPSRTGNASQWTVALDAVAA